MTVRSSLIAAMAACSLVASAGYASAACKSMGFTVNDYGKEGPTKDAKDLLDKEIAKWAAENNVDKYTVGKKTVTCELFLDVLLFDEHTCTARASVCWGDGVAAPAKTAAGEKSAPAAKKKDVATTPVKSTEEAPAADSAAVESAKPADTAKAAEPAKSESAKTEEAKDGPPVAVETGAIDKSPPAAPAPAASESDAAERAAAAAERAAAAAERAAAAAEKAAAGRTSTASGADEGAAP